MENAAEDDESELIKASAGLLSDLEASIPKLVWKKTAKVGSQGSVVHKQVRRKHLNHVIQMLEPFQGEPQLLDTKLRFLVTSLIDAYIQCIQLPEKPERTEHVDLQSAICTLLYTACKVRGQKVIVGFFNNEPRYLDLVLSALEDISTDSDKSNTGWQVPFVLLLWLSHLLLAPFDLASISSEQETEVDLSDLQLPPELPPIVLRILGIGLKYLPVSTKAQDAAASMLVRLVIRPDMQRVGLGESLVHKALQSLDNESANSDTTVYQQLGPMRFLTGISASNDLGELLPSIYRTTERLSTDERSIVSVDAVAKKLSVKISRNVAILCLHSVPVNGKLLSFVQTTSVVEDVIDYLLNSLGDRDTPVRYAAAKAISALVLQLESEMGHEVIQALLEILKEDMPRHGRGADFRTTNALKWHGLILTLAHMLFKRSAALEQLPDVIKALMLALQFEQRTATGGSIGTNVRDAANFGLWSLSRRFTTEELLAVSAPVVSDSIPQEPLSVIQLLAVQLMVSACLDPAGNVRRGSSAALQELIGRHPDQVHEGITLVQVVDYQAVGLRRRAMIEVANKTAELHYLYWSAFLEAMLGWRGLLSADVSSRDAAASSLAQLSASRFDSKLATTVLDAVLTRMRSLAITELETAHGLVLSLALLLRKAIDDPRLGHSNAEPAISPRQLLEAWAVLEQIEPTTQIFSPRLVLSLLPAAICRLIEALCAVEVTHSSGSTLCPHPETVEKLAERFLARSEETLMSALQKLAGTFIIWRRQQNMTLGCFDAMALSSRIESEGQSKILHGAGRAIALGASISLYAGGANGSEAVKSISALCNLLDAAAVEWRVIGLRAVQITLESIKDQDPFDSRASLTVVQAIHRGLNDYTIDERGDIGSLVRLQALSCVSCILDIKSFTSQPDLMQPVHSNVIRLSLEKLDRVRVAAAQCLRDHLGPKNEVKDAADVSSVDYFVQALAPLRTTQPDWRLRSLLEGCISCAGSGAESLLHASRTALIHHLAAIDVPQLEYLLTIFSAIMKTQVTESANSRLSLELLAFLLDMQIPQRLIHSDFKWRNLLSLVQKSHHKSNDIPKILTAVHVYRGLADIPAIRVEALKKLASMLKTNPYPRVRVCVAEALFFVTQEQVLLPRDWTRPSTQNSHAIKQIQQRYVE